MTSLCILALCYLSIFWQPIAVVQEQYPAWVSSAPNTLTARGNFLFAHDYLMGATIADLRYMPIQYRGNEYIFANLKVYREDHLRPILADVRNADLAIMTCSHYKDELGRIIYYFVKG